MKRGILTILTLLFLIGCTQSTLIEVTDFDSCVKAGNPVMESYPEQCAHEGTTYTNVIDFDTCVAAGNPTTKSIPPQCFDGKNNYVQGENNQAGTIPSGLTLEEQCETFEGKFIEETNECEYISKEACQELGGEFNECGSACRNNPEAEICTLQCVPFCKLN